MSNTMKQPVETIPEDRSVLFANISFIKNIHDRKSPSQGAGVLHSRFSNDPTIKQLLFSTLFKGNDGKWWRLTDRGNTWWWVQDKSASAPSTSRTSRTATSTDLGPIIGEEDIKFDTKKDEELSREFQELAIELGCKWESSVVGVQLLSSPYLYISKKKKIERGSTVTYFIGSESKEITIEQIRAQVEAKKSASPILPTNDYIVNLLTGPNPNSIKFNSLSDKKLAALFQTVMFKLGLTWSAYKDTNVRLVEQSYWIGTAETKKVTFTENFSFFNAKAAIEITKEQLKETARVLSITSTPKPVKTPTTATAPTTATSENLIELLSKKTKVKFDSKGDEKLVELFQKVVFQLGYTWPNSKDRTIQRLDQRYNYAYDDNEIANSNDNVFFEAQTAFIEITEEQLKEAADTLGVDKKINDLIIQLLPKALLNEKENQIYYINSYRYIEGDFEATFFLVLPENRGSDEDYADKYVSFSRAQMEILLNGVRGVGFYRVLTQKELQPFGQGDEVSINDFLQLNESLISAMKDSTPEVFDAFKEIIDALKDKFPDNVKSKKLYVKPTATIPTATTKSIDELIDEAKEAFLKSRKVKDLPPYLKELALRNQEKNGNPRNEDLRIGEPKENGGFYWELSNEGDDFWNKVSRQEWTSDIIMKVVGSKEKLFELPSVNSNNKKLDEKIEDAIKEFMVFSEVSKLPPYLKELVFRNQEKDGNPGKENIGLMASFTEGGFYFSTSNEGADFWEEVYNGNWLSDTVMKVVGSKENFFKLPSSATTTTATPNINKAWTPQDLVGKYITEGEKVFFVSRLKRNNPKNKAYELYNAETNVKTEWSIGMGAVIRLLDGQSLNNGKYKLVDDPKKKTPPTPTPEPTKTKDPNDYSTWSQEDLIKELEEKKEALTYFGEDDEEYIEIKAKIFTLELLID